MIDSEKCKYNCGKIERSFSRLLIEIVKETFLSDLYLTKDPYFGMFVTINAQTAQLNILLIHSEGILLQ